MTRLLSAALLAAIVSFTLTRPPEEKSLQLMCEVNHNAFDTAGYDLLHHGEKYRRAADSYSESRYFQDSISCTWRGQLVPVNGALLFWRQVPTPKPVVRTTHG